MTTALYRKHRPRTFEDILGQETNVLILKNAARTGKFGHAYLLFGPRGTGKTTTARLLAKLLNCINRLKDEKFRKIGEPCNECRACLEIDSNSCLDVIEIDAASNRGIDEIRNLKDSINTSPAANAYKVYIIDEAHMLTGAAFNALLKTLEEPPAHGVIILATTEFEKVPATISSRTQRFLFKRIPKLVIISKLKKIAAEEGISIDEPALELIASAAEGALRDAESLLDQLSSFKKDISISTVEYVTGRVGMKKVRQMAEPIVERDRKTALLRLNEISAEGHNMISLTHDLIHYLRRVLSLRLNPDLAPVFEADLTGEEIANIKKLGEGAETGKLAEIIKALIRGYSEMRYSPFAAIPLEIAIIENLE